MWNFFFWTFLLGDFSVTSVSPALWGTTDSTATVQVQVRNDGSDSIPWALPELDLTGCASPSEFNVTVLDGPFLDWPPQTTRTFRAAIHLFEQSGCGLCGSEATFTVSLHEGNGTRTAAGNASVDMPQAGYAVVEQLAHLSDPPGWITWTVETNYPMWTSPTIATPIDAATKVFLALDWDTMGWDPNIVFGWLSYPTGDGCGINHTHFGNGELTLFQGPLSDTTGQVAGTVAGSVPLQPLGGGGGQFGAAGSGWNFYDVGDVSLGHCGTVRSSLGYTTSPYITTFEMFQVPVNIREMALYLGRPTSCEPGPYAFGTAPAGSLKLHSLMVEANGDVRVEIDVPTAWKSGAQLKPDYAITWQYLHRTGVRTLTGIPPRQLDLNVQVSEWGPNSQIVAQIEHLPSGSMVSVKTPRPPFAITRQSSSFVGAESPPDNYLDPGETETVTWQLENVGERTAVSTTVAVVESNGWQARSGVVTAPTPTSINSGDTRTVVTTHELLVAECCQSLSASLQVMFTYDGATLSLPLELPFQVGSDPDTEYTSIDSSWTASVGTWNGSAVTPGGSGTGWTWSGGWSVQGDAVNTDSVYQLTSPAYALQGAASLQLNHMPGLPLAGGALEVRTHENGSWSSWSDFMLIPEIQSQLLTTFRYNSSPFYNDPDSYFADRRCWTFRELSDIHSWSVNFDWDVDQVAFRFTAQEPYWTSGWDHMWWRILEMTLGRDIAAPDQFLLAGELPTPCEGLPIHVPVNLGWYTTRGYASTAALLAANPSHEQSGTLVQWPDPPSPLPGDVLYIEVERIDGARRIWPIEPTEASWGGQPVPDFLTGLLTWTTSDPIYDLDDSSEVNVQDFVIIINAEACLASKRRRSK